MRLTLYSILLFVLLVAKQGIAGAEGFLDLYGGTAMDVKADVRVSETTSSGTTSAAATIDLSSSKEFGARLGAWHPTYNWIGLAMDFGYFHAEGHGVDISASPFSLLFALRAPLFPTPERPGGRLQPYAMAGVSFYIVDISAHLDGMGGSSTKWGWPGIANAGDPVVGPYLAAGLAWQPAKNLAIFGEYRYSTFDVEFETTDSFIFPRRSGSVDTTVDSSRLLFGISFRFGDKKSRPGNSDHLAPQDKEPERFPGQGENRRSAL